MIQFNLENWQKNKKRKICTRDGRPARIICTDGKNLHPLVAMITDYSGDEVIVSYTINGWRNIEEKYPDNYDLFFADDNELTEFEEGMKNFLEDWTLTKDDFRTVREAVKENSDKLLDLARKEFMSEITEFEIYELGFKAGKDYVLGNLPTWKKDDNNLSSLTYRLDNRGNGNILLCKKGYAISLSELLGLPKEN